MKLGRHILHCPWNRVFAVLVSVLLVASMLPVGPAALAQEVATRQEVLADSADADAAVDADAGSDAEAGDVGLHAPEEVPSVSQGEGDGPGSSGDMLLDSKPADDSITNDQPEKPSSAEGDALDVLDASRSEDLVAAAEGSEPAAADVREGAGGGSAVRRDVQAAGALRAQETSSSTDLGQFLVHWKLTVGDEVYTDENVDDDTVIEYKDGVQYSLELKFEENPTLGFETPESNPPDMTFVLPDNFTLPDGFNMPLSINLGRKGILANNHITLEKNVIGADGKTHNVLHLQWNWQDTLHWGYFRASAQAKVKIVLAGVLGGTDPAVLSLGDKDIAIRRQDLHNAFVTKSGSYDAATSSVRYEVDVTSDGTTEDITLTDTMGSALVYQGDIAYDATSSVNSAGTTPQITPKTGNTFRVVIPAMGDGDRLHFTYSAKVDPSKIAHSGSPAFEETGNTAQIFGDAYEPDNTASYHETAIEFSDLFKNAISKKLVTVDGRKCYAITWEIETNSRAQFDLAGTEVSDAIAEDVQAFSRYWGEGIRIACYSADHELCEERQLSWVELGIDASSAKDWVYHIPDTDPKYRYVITYDTLVDMDDQSSMVVVSNSAEGKGGIDSDYVVLSPVGTGGISVSKRAVDVKSTSVTWEINLSLSDDAFAADSLELREHSNTSNNKWQNPYQLPFRSIKNDAGVSKLYKETLQKVEVIGLEGQETFEVVYCGNNWDDKKVETGPYTSYYSEAGQSVMEGCFASNTGNMQDTFKMLFYRDAAHSQGGLNAPADDSGRRTVTVRLTTSFPEEWAQAAADAISREADGGTWRLEHQNWVQVLANGREAGRDTDKITPTAARVYKYVLFNTTSDADTSLALSSANSNIAQYFIRDYPYWKEPHSGYSDATDYSDWTLYPVFHFRAFVSGIQYDEPLVIEDAFDTSLFELVDASKLASGKVATWPSSKGQKYKWANEYYPVFFGCTVFNKGTDVSANSGGNKATFYKSQNPNAGTVKAEDVGCTVEETETGVRFTFTKLFREESGALYPFYGVQYYIAPKNLEALKQIEEMAKANGKASQGSAEKVSFYNTASARGSTAKAKVTFGAENDFMPLDKSSETFIRLMTDEGIVEQQLEETTQGGKTIRETPAGINPENIQSYVMKYSVLINKGAEKLNDGNDIVVEDEYGSNLSVDFTSIKITTEPAEAASKVSYDYSGNVGYFTIPDETKVQIEYEATILQATEGQVSASNTVRMLSHSKTLEDTIAHSGSSGSSATNPSILVKKYASGHMESGLNGAKFQLYEYNHATYARGDSNTEADWQPIMKSNGQPATFVTKKTVIEDKDYGDGIAEIELNNDVDGTTLTCGKVYGLREIETPTATSTNGETITYSNPHSEGFFCYVFSIAENQVADYSNYVYLDGDTMTVRNSPESVSLHLRKALAGNVQLTDGEKQGLTYQLFKKRRVAGNESVFQYQPIMRTITNDAHQEVEVVDEHFRNITYEQIAASADGLDIAGLTLEGGTEAGEYLLVEYGNEQIRQNHPDWSWKGTYEWSDGSTGTFSKQQRTVYDENGSNPQQVYGVEFTVTSQEVKDGEGKSITLTNTYSRETVTLSATKKWLDPGGNAAAWPAGATATFELGTVENGAFTSVSGIARIVLDNTKDNAGESTAGTATFKNLPKYRVTEGGGTEAIAYAVREESFSPASYTPVYPDAGASYAPFGSGMQATIKNRAPSTSTSAIKEWNLKSGDAAGTATFRLYSYTGTDASLATWVSNVDDIVLDGIIDTGEGTFGEKTTAWKADFTGLARYDAGGNELHYVVKEIACTPVGYEANKEYAANGEIITNRPATTSFEVSKVWRGTPENAWPTGEVVELVLHRRNAAGEDEGFSATYKMSKDAIVEPATHGNAAWDGSKLVISELEKVDGEGRPWTYYALEKDMLAKGYSTTYYDRYGYFVSGIAYSGGTIRNTLSMRNLTLTKAVSGNMADASEEFSFTVSLMRPDGSPFEGELATERSSGGSAGAIAESLVFEDGSASLSLKHGDTLTVKGAPAASSFTVTEAVSGYAVSWESDDGTSDTAATATGALTADRTISFTNTRNALVPIGVKPFRRGAATIAVVLLLALSFAQMARRKRG